MHATPLFADEWSLEVNAQDFGPRFLRPMLLRDVQRNARCRADRGVRRGGDRRGQQRCSAELSHFPRDNAQRVAVTFHDVAPARAMNVNVNESRDRRFPGCVEFRCPRGET